MTTPIPEATKAVGKAFNWKLLLFQVVLTILVTIIVSRIMRQTVTMYDSTGKVTGVGEIKPELKFSLKKS